MEAPAFMRGQEPATYIRPEQVAEKVAKRIRNVPQRLKRLRKEDEEGTKAVPSAAKADRVFKQLRHD